MNQRPSIKIWAADIFCNLKMNYRDFLNVNKLAKIVMMSKTTDFHIFTKHIVDQLSNWN